MPVSGMSDRAWEPPWQRTGVSRTRRQWVQLLAVLLTGLYVANSAANGLYKVATQWQVEMVQQRMDSLVQLDPEAPQIAQMKRLLADADYKSLTEFAPSAIIRRASVKAYLKQHPHLALGIAVDGDRHEARQVVSMLRHLNTGLRPYRMSVGLAQPAIEIKIPLQATRDDILRGITTAFRHKPDYVVALSSRRCAYTGASTAEVPSSNRLYTFGWRGLTVVDNAVAGRDLADRLQMELGTFLQRNTLERRWKAEDYDRRPEDLLTGHQVIGRVWRGLTSEAAAGERLRSIRVSVGLDGVSEVAARRAISDANMLFRPFHISFQIERLHSHRLSDEWKWPVEMKRMMRRGESEIYLLFTGREWVSPSQGAVRGLANATVGAVLIQTGTPAQTMRRLTHELGHLFGLPHTLLRGHVMYPNEGEIGLIWSPGSKRLLGRNRLFTRWYSSLASPARLDVAIQMAPVIRRAAVNSAARQSQEAAASGDVWVSCGAG